MTSAFLLLTYFLCGLLILPEEHGWWLIIKIYFSYCVRGEAMQRTRAVSCHSFLLNKYGFYVLAINNAGYSQRWTKAVKGSQS